MREVKYKTIEESRLAYKEYVDSHIKAVQYAARTFGLEFAELIEQFRTSTKEYDGYYVMLYRMVLAEVKYHDKSKYGEFEFDQYRRHFYPSEEDLQTYTKEQIDDDFEKAWIHHYNNNEHHPEFWHAEVTESKFPEKRKLYFKMSNTAFLEMLLDWIGVSITFKSNVLDWWNNDKGGKFEKRLMLDNEDMDTISSIFKSMPEILDFTNSNIEL